MNLKVRKEVRPFVVASLLTGGLITLGMQCLWPSCWPAALLVSGIAVTLCGYFLYFFRDPDRTPPAEDVLIVSGADGIIASVTAVYEGQYLKADCIRISVFLSLFDVHVNRAPISGEASFLGYFPGRHFFTFQEKSSEFNQHNKILIQGRHTRCLLSQIVGPVCRRVVYWLDKKKPQSVTQGERIGMMKFGSRLDMVFPAENFRIKVAIGQKVKAGETVIGSFTKMAEAEERHDDG